MQFNLKKQDVAITSIDITFDSGENTKTTTWHLRRVGSSEMYQIELDLASYRKILSKQVNVYQKQLMLKAILESLQEKVLVSGEGEEPVYKTEYREPSKEVTEQIEELNKEILELSEQCSLKPADVAPVFSHLCSLIVRVDGAVDESGESIKWSTLDSEDRHAMVQYLDAFDAHQMINKAIEASSLSNVAKKK